MRLMMTMNMRRMRALVERAETMNDAGVDQSRFSLIRTLGPITETASMSPEDREFYLNQRTTLQNAMDALRTKYHETNDGRDLHAYYAAKKELDGFDDTYDLFGWKKPVDTSREDDYKGQHTAPMHDSGSPLWNVAARSYPEDFYTRPAHEYSDGTPGGIRMAYYVRGMRNKPNISLKMYRAIPKNLPRKINVGDWVTLSRQYAVDHGRMHLQDDYVIVSKTVFARDVFTNGDSLEEWGYDPQPRVMQGSKTRTPEEPA